MKIICDDAYTRQDAAARILAHTSKPLPVLTTDIAIVRNSETRLYVNPNLKIKKQTNMPWMATDVQLAILEDLRIDLLKRGIRTVPLDMYGRLAVGPVKPEGYAEKAAAWFVRPRMSHSVRSKRVGLGIQLGQRDASGRILCAARFGSVKLFEQVQDENKVAFEKMLIIRDSKKITALFWSDRKISLQLKGCLVTSSGHVSAPGSPDFNSKTFAIWLNNPDKSDNRTFNPNTIVEVIKIATANLPNEKQTDNKQETNKVHSQRIFEVQGSGLENVFESVLYRSINNRVGIDCDLDLFARRLRNRFPDLSANGREWCARRWYYKATERQAIPSGTMPGQVVSWFEAAWQTAKQLSDDFLEKSVAMGEVFEPVIPDSIQGLDRKIVKLSLGIMKVIGPKDGRHLSHMACSVVAIYCGCSETTANTHMRDLEARGILVMVEKGIRNSWDRYATVWTLSKAILDAVRSYLIIDKPSDDSEKCDIVEENGICIHRIPNTNSATEKKGFGAFSVDSDAETTEFVPETPLSYFHRGPPEPRFRRS